MLFQFLGQRDELQGHFFLTATGADPVPSELRSCMKKYGGLRFLLAASWRGLLADKIVIHGLFGSKLLLLMALQPWLLRKACWILWGGDLYSFHDRRRSLRHRYLEVLRRRIIGNIPQIFSATPGDGELCRSWYGIKGEYVNVFTYPNSLIRPRIVQPRRHGAALKVLVGNSAVMTNAHEEIFQLLRAADDGCFELNCPLSYGDAGYREKIIALGHRMFAGRFRPMVEKIPYEQYLEFLASVDIAVFNHDRQQAMSTIRALLGYGKRVYMRPGSTSWSHLESLGVTVFDIKDLMLDPEFPQADENRRIICDFYSEDRLVEGLRKVFARI